MKRGNIRKSLTEGSQRIREHNLKTRKVKARYHLKIRVVSLQKRGKIKKKKKSKENSFSVVCFLSGFQIWEEKIFPSLPGKLYMCKALHFQLFPRKYM